MNEKTQPCTHCGAVHPRVNLTWMGSAELWPGTLLEKLQIQPAAG